MKFKIGDKVRLNDERKNACNYYISTENYNCLEECGLKKNLNRILIIRGICSIGYYLSLENGDEVYCSSSESELMPGYRWIKL